MITLTYDGFCKFKDWFDEQENTRDIKMDGDMWVYLNNELCRIGISEYAKGKPEDVIERLTPTTPINKINTEEDCVKFFKKFNNRKVYKP